MMADQPKPKRSYSVRMTTGVDGEMTVQYSDGRVQHFKIDDGPDAAPAPTVAAPAPPSSTAGAFAGIFGSLGDG